ncbi:MAG TPA: hypothetical protein VMD59_00990, partial [Acidimicrobiales bacterium]|nr:hypothetical protein [Acidimicrobiales bacterium]
VVPRADGSDPAGGGSDPGGRDPGGGSLVIDEADLVVPHPRMAERAFVLAPLEDLEPSRVPAGWRESLGGAEAVGATVRRAALLEPPSGAAGWRAAAAAGNRG